MENKQPPEIEIWFDDALKDVYVYFLPIMEKYGLKGIVPVVTDYVGGRFRWYYRFTRDVKSKKVTSVDYTKYVELQCMSIDELKILIMKGWKIACHTKTHRLLTKLNCAETEKEFKESKEWIEKNLGVTPEDIVCPWNGIEEWQKELALKYFKRIVSSDRIYFHGIHLPAPDDWFTLEIFESRLKSLILSRYGVNIDAGTMAH